MRVGEIALTHASTCEGTHGARFASGRRGPRHAIQAAIVRFSEFVVAAITFADPEASVSQFR